MKNKLQFLLLAVLVLTVAVVSNAQITSAASGNWSAGATWVGGVVPSSGDVIIANGHTVTIDQNVSVTNLTVGGGTSGTLTFDKVARRVVTVSGNITVAAGGTFIAQDAISTTGDLAAASTSITNVASTAGVVNGMNIGTLTGIAAGTTVASFTANTITLSVASTNTAALTGAILAMGYDDTLSIGGNLTNNGTFDMTRGNAAGICHVFFTKAGDQTISGSGATTRFRNITLNKTAITNKVIASINVTTSGSNIIFNAGTWEQNAGRLTAASGSIAIGSLTATSCALNIIGSAGASIASNLNVYGAFLLNTTDSLIVGSGTSKIDLTYIIGASATFTKGTVLVNGKFATAALTATTINGANIIIDPKGFAAASGTDYAFRATTGTGGTNPFTFTSGTITILNPNSTASSNPELAMSSSIAPNISGTATFILGQGANTVASAAGFKINLNVAGVINHLTINTGSVGVTLQSNVIAKGTLTMKSCGTLGGAFKWKADNYLFNGGAAQVTGTIMPDTVRKVVINNSLGVTSSQALFISDTLVLTKGALTGPFTARVTVTGGTAVPDVNSGLPREFVLAQNYPNPFNPSTTIQYELPVGSNVTLSVYDVLGKEVATLVNGNIEAGVHSVQFNAANISSGIYFYMLRTGSFVENKKMMFLK
jgi:hypothetical protein